MLTSQRRPFLTIVPCGINDRPVTSVERLLGARPGVQGLPSQPLRSAADIRAEFEPEQQALLQEYRFGLLEGLAEVFGLDLEEPEPSDRLSLENFRRSGATVDRTQTEPS